MGELAGLYGHPTWERRLDPTSELILTILTQNSADTNAEVAFEALRQAYPSGDMVRAHNPGAGWGGEGLPDGAAPDWDAVEHAPIPELVDVIRPGGLANQKAPRIQATLAYIREERGDHSLEFLGGPAHARGARLADRHRRDRQEDGVGPAAVLVRQALDAGGPPRGARLAPGRAHPEEGLGRRRARPVSRPAQTRPRCTRPTST